MYEYSSNSRKNYSETGLSDMFEIQKDSPLVIRCDSMVNLNQNAFKEDYSLKFSGSYSLKFSGSYSLIFQGATP